MDLLTIVIALIVLCVVLYVVNQVMVLPAQIKMLVNVVLCLALLLWVLVTFLGPLMSTRVG